MILKHPVHLTCLALVDRYQRSWNRYSSKSQPIAYNFSFGKVKGTKTQQFFGSQETCSPPIFIVITWEGKKWWGCSSLGIFDKDFQPSTAQYFPGIFSYFDQNSNAEIF